LAHHRPDVDDFLDELSPQQFDEWLAYFRIQPVSDDAALLASLINNAGWLIWSGLTGADSTVMMRDAADYLGVKAKSKKATRYLSPAEIEAEFI
jgi:hypothetical protein